MSPTRVASAQGRRLHLAFLSCFTPLGRSANGWVADRPVLPVFFHGGGDWEAELGAIAILTRRHFDFSSLCQPRPRSVAVMDNLAAPTVGVCIPPWAAPRASYLIFHVLLVSLVPLLLIFHILLVSLVRKRISKDNTSSLRVIRVICEK